MVEYEFAESYLEPTTISLNFALVVVTIDIDNLMLNPELAKIQRKFDLKKKTYSPDMTISGVFIDIFGILL